jgi:NCS1 family nucleobase:cation symporter-1
MVNGRAGNKYGIPFVAQSRTSFGMKGAIFPMFLRAVPAICWYGIQSWIGATALCQVLDIMFSIGTSFGTQFICFVFFQGIQILLSATGFRGVKWIENIGTVIIVISLAYMLYVMVAYLAANYPSIWSISKAPGVCHFSLAPPPSWASSPLDDQNPRLLQEVIKFDKPKSSMTGIIWLGLVPPVLFMGLIGLMAANVTGQWDPIYLFVELLPNSFVLIVALLFIALAQITTNVMANVIPPS